jgi:hypothetical protein
MTPSIIKDFWVAVAGLSNTGFDVTASSSKMLDREGGATGSTDFFARLESGRRRTDVLRFYY